MTTSYHPISLSKALKSISVFDLDHTLLNCNSSFHFVLYLFKKKRLSLLKLLYVAGTYGWHKMGFTSLEGLYGALFKRILQGKSSLELRDLAESFIAEHIDTLLFQPLVDELREAQKQGSYTVILSCSSDFLVAPIAAYMGFNEWGAVCYREDGSKRYTEISSMMAGQDKANYVSSLIERFKISIEEVTAYTDSYLDLPLLYAVGEAVCVNPDKRLRKLALKNCWKILN